MQIITTDPEPRKVIDINILLSSGMTLPFLVEEAVGDKFFDSPEGFGIYLSPKPTQSDPTKFLPAESITVFKAHIASIQVREREVLPKTPEELEFWAEALQLHGK